jgi:hypothetical protein
MKPVCNLDAKFTVFVIIAQSLCVSRLMPIQKIQELCKSTNQGLSAYIRRYFVTKSTDKWRWREPQYYGKGNKVVKTKQHNIYRTNLFRDGLERYSKFLRPHAAFLRIITAFSMRSTVSHFVSRSSSKQHFCSSLTHNSEGPRIESWWGRHFPQPSTPVLVPTQPHVQFVPGTFLRG